MTRTPGPMRLPGDDSGAAGRQPGESRRTVEPNAMLHWPLPGFDSALVQLQARSASITRPSGLAERSPLTETVSESVSSEIARPDERPLLCAPTPQFEPTSRLFGSATRFQFVGQHAGIARRLSGTLNKYPDGLAV